jgi:putative sigma-54 modulation protein
MRIEVTGHQIDVTTALRAYVNDKFERLARHGDGELDARVVLSVEKLRHKTEAKIMIPGNILFADCDADTMYAAIDLLVDKLDRLLQKHKGKQSKHQRSEGIARSENLG